MTNSNGCIRVFADQKQIERCKQNVLEVSASVSMLSKALHLAGNEVRLNILYLLYNEGELCVCDMSDILNMKAPAISQHLRKMRDGGIINNRKDAQTIYYFLETEYHELFENFFLLIGNNQLLKKVS